MNLDICMKRECKNCKSKNKCFKEDSYYKGVDIQMSKVKDKERKGKN